MRKKRQNKKYIIAGIISVLVIAAIFIAAAGDVIVDQGNINVNDLVVNGNVGIGTVSPEKKLTISNREDTSTLTPGKAVTGIELINTAATALPSRMVNINFANGIGDSRRYAAISGLVTGSSSAGQIGSIIFSTKSLVGSTSLTERIRINPNGKVGIGTASPGATLHVKGTLKIESSLPASQGLCLKSDKTIGTCRTTLNSTGGCTCA